MVGVQNRFMVDGQTMLLVHSPLVGPMTFEPTAAALRRRGQRVVVPSLAGIADGDPPYYRRLARAAVHEPAIDGPVVLVGHSGAGALLPTIAELVNGDVRGAVFVDALLPHPGQSWFDTAPAELREHLAGLVWEGRLPRWNEWFPDAVNRLVPDAELRERVVAELPTLAVRYFEEPAPEVGDGWAAIRCAYVRLSEAYDDLADDAERRGWWVHREEADHLATLTQPERIADLIIRATAAMT